MKQILIIDSDVEVTDSLSHELGGVGYDVVARHTAQDGLALAPQASLIILAVELPDMNGFALCSTLKRSMQTADIPVFITSSATTTTAFEKHLNLANHADGYFLKPLDIPALIEQVNGIFAQYEAYAEAIAAQVDSEVVPETISTTTELPDQIRDANEASSLDDDDVKSLDIDDMSIFQEITGEALDDDDDDSAIPFDDGTPEPNVEAMPKAVPPVATPISSRSSVSLPPRVTPIPANSTSRVPPIGAHTAKTLLPRQKSFVGASLESSNVTPKPAKTVLPVSVPSPAQAPVPPIPASSPLHAQIEALNAQIADLQSQIANRDEIIAQLKAQRDQEESSVLEVRRELDAVKAQNEALMQSIAEQQAQVATLTQVHAQKDQQIENIARQLLELVR